MLGVILLPRSTVVQLCFVASGHLGKGIGRDGQQREQTQ